MPARFSATTWEPEPLHDGKSIAAYETIETSATTMSPLGSKYGWKLRTWVYGSGRYLLPRVPYLFEYSDPVQAIGFTHSLFVVASGDERCSTVPRPIS